MMLIPSIPVQRERSLRRVKTFLLFITACAVALVTGELALHVLGIEYPLIYQGDWHRGASLAPGAAGWIGTEGGSYVRINSKGLQDREHVESKADGVYRIAVLGDSYAEATQVEVHDTFWSRLESNLDRCPAFAGNRVEVINFGVSGYGTAQELITLRRHVWQYSPDLVLLAFFQGNDVKDNSRTLSEKTYRPFFRVENNELIEDVSFRDTPYFKKSMSAWVKAKNKMINNSRLLQLLYHVKKTSLTPLQDEVKKETKQNNIEMEHGLSASIYMEPGDDAWEEAWDITERLIKTMDREVKQRGSDFLLVTLSTSQQVHRDHSAVEQFKKELNIRNLFYTDDRLARFARDNGINVLNLARNMQAYAQENNVFLHGFGNTTLGTGHWNQAGHRLAAELIADHLCNELGPRPLAAQQ